MAASLLIAGTTSDAGKSTVVTALCRAYARRGVRVAPYKAQNMSNNSMVTEDASGTAEIGRAQWIQAKAARATPESAMNPVLLKPGGDRRSHVMLMGQPAGTLSSADFTSGRTHLATTAHAAYDDLAGRYDLVICEGAGSPAEINLRDSDFVNMGLARHGDIPVVLVGDIDRGGVFAALYGTVALLGPDDQRLVAGLVINRFRGDQSLLTPGLRELEELTKRPVLGVLPWHSGLWMDSEDTIDVGAVHPGHARSLRVAVVRLPRISNFTDVDALSLEPDVDVEFVTDPRSLAGAALVVLPGTRATLDDLAWLRTMGLDRAIVAHARAGGSILGICGGFQMLGASISDPDGVEGAAGAEVPALGLLDVATTFTQDKALGLRTGKALGETVTGYEIHHGRIQHGHDDEFVGGATRGAVSGTMWHGSLESDGFRSAYLAEVAQRLGHRRTRSGVSFTRCREERLDLLGDLADRHLDLDALLDLARNGAPPVPVIEPGGSRR